MYRRNEMKKIVKVLPYYEARMWGGGHRLEEEFGYHTDVKPLGEVYNVVALKGHADCAVPEMNMTLSELYEKYPDWFECETEELPVRVNILDPIDKLSVQIHPDDTFAKEYNGGRGKPECWVILDTTEDGYIEFGHHARTREEFRQWCEAGEYDQLLKYLKTEKDAYIDIPTGTLHAIGAGVLTYNLSRNADLTLRLYDYDRIDPETEKPRPIQPDDVIDHVNIPDTSGGFEHYPVSHELGVDVTRYCDQPGLYTLMRLQVKQSGKFLHERFSFLTCVNGSGTVNGIPIQKGETVLVPHGTGWLEIEGDLDLFLASYRNQNTIGA